MAEQESGRSELPTQHKLEEARKKGSVVRSADVGSLGVLFGFLFAMFAAGAGVVGAVRQAFLFCLGPGLSSSPVWVLPAVSDLVVDAMTLPLLVLVVFALAAAMAQHRLLFSFEPLKPDWKKINPVEGMKRLFSLRSLFALAMAIFKSVVLGAVSYVIFSQYLDRTAQAIGHPTALWDVLKSLVWATAATLVVAFAIFAALDFIVSRRLYIRQLMMSPREIKEESRRREGDPLIKRRIREYRMEMLKKARALGSVAGSSFVITNPTHFAVAIKYDPHIIDAPVIVAKGGGVLASRIRQIARRHGVPVYERKRLTRFLYFNASLGQPVPVECYREIAVLLKQSRARRRKE